MITEEMLNELRNRVASLLSERRYNHTLGVERMARFLADHCLPEKKAELSAAAILHDVTKELPIDVQLKIIDDVGENFNGDDLVAAVIHSFTAPIIVKKDFSDFATDEILSAIAKHTVGDDNMSVFDKIIFLADFIEDSRVYPDSISTQKFVKESMRVGCLEENVKILNTACVMEIDSTLSHLKKCGKSINPKSLLAKASMLSKN